jgi:hypothetical protein
MAHHLIPVLRRGLETAAEGAIGTNGEAFPADKWCVRCGVPPDGSRPVARYTMRPLISGESSVLRRGPQTSLSCKGRLRIRRAKQTMASEAGEVLDGRGGLPEDTGENRAGLLPLPRDVRGEPRLPDGVLHPL